MLIVFWRPQEWLFPFLYGFNILNIVFILAILSFLVEYREGKLHIPRGTPQRYLIWGLWIGPITSHLAHTFLAALIVTNTITFKFAIFTFFLYVVLDRYTRLRKVGLIFVFMAIFMAIHALMQQKLGYGFGGLRPILGGDYKGKIEIRSVFYGIFEDPNDLSHFLATCLPFSFIITKRKSIFGILLGVAISYLLVLGILATHSRGGLVGVAAAIGVIMIMILPDRWAPKLIGVGMIGALVLCTAAGSFMDDSAHDRVAFWGEANEAFKHTPIFGVGFGMLIEYIQEDRAVHNAFVLCYAENGLFGYWFWFGLLYLGVLGTWRARMALSKVRNVNAQWVRRYAGMAIAATAGYSAAGYFLQRAYIYPLFFLFAILGAIPVIARQYLPDDYPPFFNLKKDYMMNTIVSIGSVVYIYISILILNSIW